MNDKKNVPASEQPRLVLEKETVRRLDALSTEDLKQVAGGMGAGATRSATR